MLHSTHGLNNNVRTFWTDLKYNLIFFKLNGMLYLRNIFLILFIDCLVTDDEPIWEPLEWTLVQTWLLFIFFFSWIAEALISSKYGSFTGRDKRVYFGLFKSYWYAELWFMVNLLVVSVFIIVPFYFEVTYSLSSVVTWWNWYNRVFFFKFIFLFFFITLINLTIKLGLKWLNWKKIFMLTLLIGFILAFLLYMQFIVVFFAYFGDAVWYKQSGWCDYQNLSNGPLKWGWGSESRDHFSYHKTPINFWFKNDSLYASSLFLINFFVFLSLIFLNFQWLLIIRKIYSTKEISFTFIVYGVSSLMQFFYYFVCMYFFVIVSFIYQLLRFPLDLFWFDKIMLFVEIILVNLLDYHELLFLIFSKLF